MSRSAAARVAAELAALALAAGCARAAEPSAAEIVARNAAARGGLEAWRKVETMVWTGHIESSHAPVPGLEFRLEQKRPNKTRMEITGPGERSLRAFDGVRGWKMRSVQGRPELQPYTLQELKFAQAGHGIDGPLIDHAAKGISVTLEGLEEIDKRKAYHLKVRAPKGSNEDVWVDAETYLEIRYDRMADAPVGEPRRVSVTYGDYRPVEGLRIPFLIETGGGTGATPDKLLIEKVVLNAPLGDSTFASPAARWRGRGRPDLAPRARAPTRSSTAPTPGGELGAAPQ